MGWLWSSPSPPLSPSPSCPPQSTTPSSDTYTSKPSTTQNPTSTPTRDELADRELQCLLEELEADIRPSTKYNRVPRLPPPSFQSPSSTSQTPFSQNENQTKNENQTREEILAESLLPRTMSCRQAFDSAFYCQSLGGQFNNLYRYGTIRSCSENWGDFWFCMRTRSYSPEEKAEMVKRHYGEKERRRYGRDGGGRGGGGNGGRGIKVEEETREEIGRSSEDIWRSRETKVGWGEAFRVPVPGEGDEKIDDEEWNQRESIRRVERVDGAIVS